MRRFGVNLFKTFNTIKRWNALCTNDPENTNITAPTIIDEKYFVFFI